MKRIFTLIFSLFLFSMSAQWINLGTGVSNELRTVDAVDADHIYAAGQNVVLKSVNGGSSWSNSPFLNNSNQPISALTINDLHFFDAQTGIAVGVQAGLTRLILRTTDGGAHWTTVLSSNDPNGNIGGFSKVHFISPSTGWAVGSSGLVSKTVNAGLNWTSVIIPNVTNLYDVQFIDGQVGMVCGENDYSGEGSQQVLAQSTDGGQNWNQWIYSSGATLRELYILSPQVVFVADDQGLVIRLNEGANLVNSTNVSMPDAAPVRRLHFLNATTGYALTDFSVRKTTTTGLFWEQATLPLSTGQEMLDFDFLADGLTGFAVGRSGKAFRTLNGGAPLLPMAYFFPEPFVNGLLCKDSLYHFNNPAPETAYSSQWFLNNQLYSTQNDITISFPQTGAVYSLRLRITGPNGFSDYTQTIETFPDLDFSFGELEWTYFPPVCSQNTVAFKVNNPASGVQYTAFVNDVPFLTLYANGVDPLQFTTPPLTESAVIRVEGLNANPCSSLIKSDTLHALVYVYPDRNSPVETSTPLVCLYDSASVTIHDSEVGAFYRFLGGTTEAVPLEGNGGDLTFFTPPLFQTDNYQIIASRGPCSWPLNQSVSLPSIFFSTKWTPRTTTAWSGRPFRLRTRRRAWPASNGNFMPALRRPPPLLSSPAWSLRKAVPCPTRTIIRAKVSVRAT